MIEKNDVLMGLTGLLALGFCPGEEVEELEPLTVLARRLPSVADQNASSVGIVTADELAQMQRNRLLGSLELVPGAQALSTAGLTGNTGTAIIRGLPSAYQQVIVDGVRISGDANGIGNFLANGQLGSITRLEVLRGPQSVLYGTGAGGGVIGYETMVGDSEPGFKFFGEGGSFDSYRFALGSRGRWENLAYGVEIGSQFTSNDTYKTLPLHDYEQHHANLALQWDLRDDLRLKLSYRGSDNFLKTRSISPFGPQDSEIRTEMSMFALNAFYDVSPNWSSRFTMGFYQENYRGDFGGFHFGTDYERFTVNWSNEVELHDELTLVAGLESAHGRFSNTSGRNADDSINGVYAKVFYRPVESLLLEAGGRLDHHNTFGDDLAWDLGAVYEIPGSGTRLHARLSKAYRNPTRLDSDFFMSPFSTQLANPDLESEGIRGMEIGVSRRFETIEAGLTYFHQDLDNAIMTRLMGPGTTQRVNQSGKSALSGLEFSASGRFLEERLKLRVSYTAQFEEEVIDLPDQMAAVNLNYDAGPWMVGGGLSYVGGAGYLGGKAPSTDERLVARIYGEYRFNESLTLHARVENLFDEEYESFPDTFGAGSQIEGEGRAFYVGATYSW